MLRNIVKIDQNKCDGCGLCVTACAEGAIQIIDGKAQLVSDTYCDGLGACLGHCPQDAITIEQREAAEFDEEATQEYLASLDKKTPAPAETPAKPVFQGCPGSMARKLAPKPIASDTNTAANPSQLANWPVQLSLVSPNAPYFQDADLLLVADCVPFAYPDFHNKFLKGNPVIIGCPKLDDTRPYIEKLTMILNNNNIKSLTILHMEVPCCTGLVRLADLALAGCDKNIKVNDVTIGIQGNILE